MKNIEKEIAHTIVEKAEKIISVYETEGKAAARELWKDLDASVPDREELSDEDLDLMTELEFFLDESPAGDMKKVKQALAGARIQLESQ